MPTRGLIRRLGLVLAVAMASAVTVREWAVFAQADAPAVRAFIKAPDGVTRVAESVATDASGNVYGGENGSMKLVKYVKP